MQPEARQKRIQDYLNRAEFASLEELAREVGASVSTVRRDITALESAGSLRRMHGGARLINPPSDEFAFTARDTHQLAEKEAIGRACAELIRPNQTVIIDAGTTAWHVAKYLEPKTPQIITNSLPVANFFAANNRIELILSGGVIYPRLGVLVGPLAVEHFQNPCRRGRDERGGDHAGGDQQLARLAHRDTTGHDPRRATGDFLL
jgi:DeoR family fructose operon transcriptional repressor